MYALLYSLIIVNGLNLLKKTMMINKEGFEMNESGEITGNINDEDKVLIIEWIKNNNIKDFMLEYVNYDKSIDDEMLPLATIIDNISNIDTEGDEIDLDNVDNLIDYIKQITTMEDSPTEELDFVNMIVEKMIEEIDFSSEELDDSESETVNSQQKELKNQKENIEKKIKELNQKLKRIKNKLRTRREKNN
tara:strand:+ start:349 stop:921 length:573 start_codon:yes stop_codon:yes gene_type:complete